MSLKLKTMTLHVVIAGCMSMAFYAQADVKIGVAGPFTGPNATYGAQYWKGASQAAARPVIWKIPIRQITTRRR